MPERELPRDIPGIFKDIFRRLNNVERRRFPISKETLISFATRSYSWQSPFTLAEGTGHKFHADRDGSIKYIRAERSSGDGTSTATFDVRRNGVSLFSARTAPYVDAGDRLGPEAVPKPTNFKKGDNFEVEITGTGGGTGPLRITICFVETVT